ncbi:MAG TPA: amidohydrolase, partial [Tissierellales bacterium]|nr:amidohydrolase [Tissierellales bacterium]
MIDDDYLFSEVSELEEWIIKVRRDFHRYPELGFQEYRTRDKIIEYLEEMDIKYKIVVETGVVALIEGKQKGKTVALRADIDALPMDDRKDVHYKSKIEGKMHSCG